ncbi:MAG: glycosyltransferase [Phycisphaerae bacterium]|nr:glycosyltransferase [Phycisphaerae bacterium]
MSLFVPRILVLTQMFPNSAYPHRGSFVSERVRVLCDDAEIRVINPVPYFPPVPGLGRYSRLARVGLRGETSEGCHVLHPRYAVLPRVATFYQGLSMARAVRRQCERDPWKPDIIDAHFAFPDGYAAVRLGRELGCPVVVTCHGSDLATYPRRFGVRRMMRWTMTHATRVLAVAPHLREAALQLGGAPHHVEVLPGGVDCDIFFPRNRLRCRTNLGLPIDRPVALCVAGLDDNKNQAVLLHALAEVIRRGGKLHLALVGDGPTRASLEKQAAELGVTECVTLAGSRPYVEVPQWISAADWLVLASRREGWPTVYCEAMACGRPVLTANVAVARTAIDRDELGMVLDENSPRAWADAFEAARARKWDEQAIRRLALNHSWKQWASHYLALVREVLGRRQIIGAAA